MKVKTQKNIVIAFAYAAFGLTILTFNPDTGLGWKLATIAFLALALVLNCLVFRRQLLRNKKRNLAYYMGVEWWHRTSVGWEGVFHLPETIGELMIVLWAYIGWHFGFEDILPHIAFVALGLIIASVLFYTSYRFKSETRNHDPFDARSKQYRGWLGLFAFGVSTTAAVIATFFGADIYQVFFIAISGVCVEAVRLFLFFLEVSSKRRNTRRKR